MISKKEFKQFSILVKDFGSPLHRSPVENIFIGLDFETTYQNEYNEEMEYVGKQEHSLIKAKDIITGVNVNWGPHMFTTFRDFISGYKGYKILLEKESYKNYNSTDSYSFISAIKKMNDVIKYAKVFVENADILIQNLEFSYQFSEYELSDEEKKSISENFLKELNEISELELLYVPSENECSE